MGFLDDLGKGLNKVGKKTSEMAGAAKIKLEITKLKGTIDKKYEALGSRVYFLKKENTPLDESVDVLIDEIDELFANVQALEAEIAEPVAKKCTQCGAVLEEGTKFCGSCGQPTVQTVETPVVEGKTCPNCGAEVGDAKFCNSCGTNIE